MTNGSETGQDELTAHRLLDAEMRQTLDEVIHHSLGRTGEVACAIEAGLVALRDGAVLEIGHREALEEFAGMVSECAGVGLRYARWRDAVYALLRTLRPDPLREILDNLSMSLTPQQAEQLVRPLSEQQKDLLQQAVNLMCSHDE